VSNPPTPTGGPAHGPRRARSHGPGRAAAALLAVAALASLSACGGADAKASGTGSAGADPSTSMHDWYTKGASTHHQMARCRGRWDAGRARLGRR
jgi:hypothetical protein